jgi:transglutaminase-like putative cysteine protease
LKVKNLLSARTIRFSLAALFLFLCCQPSHAGWFGKDKQDLPQWGLDASKTPTPAYVKDAANVVLYEEYLESVDDQGRATERRRKAFRILKPQGRNDAFCGVSFDMDQKINYFREWTIAADQKQYQAQDTDFIDIGSIEDSVMLSAAKTRVVRPPAADVGAVIVCESEELLEPYIKETDWSFQGDSPVVYQALEVDLPAGRAHTDAWHRYEPIKPVEVAPNHWRWEIKDMHALDLRDVKARPEWEALAARMSVQWGDAAVDGKDNQWRAIGQWTTTLEANRPDPSPEITAQTQSLIAGAPDFYTKLSRITEYIQKNIRYFIVVRGIGGLQANHASDIFRNRYGDCKDKTTLLISMLQAAGIHAVYMPVDSRRGIVDPDEPSLYGNHMITAIEIPADVQDPRLMAVVKAKDGKRYLIFDPTDERTPVGNLPSEEQGGYGILAAGAASQILALPVLDPKFNGSERKGAFTLSADGTLTGSVDSSSIGPKGADLRSFLKYTDEKERREYWEKLVSATLPGVTLDAFQFVQPSALDKPLEFHYKVTAHQYSHQAGQLLLVRPRVVGSYATPFDDKKREYAIDLDATGRWHDSFDIAIPTGYVVDEIPDPVAIDLDFASYHSTVSAQGSVLHYEREYIVRQVEIPPTRALDFRHFESAILADEKNAAVLKKQ